MLIKKYKQKTACWVKCTTETVLFLCKKIQKNPYIKALYNKKPYKMIKKHNTEQDL